jgi:hypothetical protein
MDPKVRPFCLMLLHTIARNSSRRAIVSKLRLKNALVMEVYICGMGSYEHPHPPSACLPIVRFDIIIGSAAIPLEGWPIWHSGEDVSVVVCNAPDRPVSSCGSLQSL